MSDPLLVLSATLGTALLVDCSGNDRYRAVCPTCFYSEVEDPAHAPGLFG